MAKTKPGVYCMLVFLMIASVYLIYQRSHKLKVFILHSYGQEQPRTHALNRGVSLAFKNKEYLNTQYFYMDAKTRHSKHYLARVSQQARRAIYQFKPDVLVVFDGEARDYVAKHFVDRHDMNMIFSGLGGGQTRIRYKHTANVTGVNEYIPMRAVREVSRLMFHRAKKIVYLSDSSVEAKNLFRAVGHSSWPGFTLVKQQKVRTVKAWKQAILKAKSQADIILLGSYQGLIRTSKPVDFKALIAWALKHSSIPIIGIHSGFFQDGGLIALRVSPIEQGYGAASLALEVIEDPGSLGNKPILRSQSFELKLAKEKIKRYYPNAYIPIILDVFAKKKWALDDIK